MTSVLWYSNETPDLHGQGGQRRQYFQIRSLLQAHHDVVVVSLAGEQDDESIGSLTEVHRLPGPGRWSSRFPRWRGRETARLLERARCDRVVVAHLESWVHLRRRRISLSRPRLLDVHNVFSHWHRRLGDRRLSSHWHEVENSAAREFDSISVCSTRELEAFRASTGRDAIVLPHGIEPSEWPHEPRPQTPVVVKLFGNWGWAPNRDGLAWVLDEVVPRLDPAARIRFEVAGAGTENWKARTDVTFLGRVPDVARFLADAWLVGLPVRNGVGAPVKFAESLVTGIPLLATTDAASGEEEPPDVLVSDDPAAWVQRINAVVRDPEPYRTAAHDRRTRVLAQGTWQRMSTPLCRWVEES